MDSVHAMRETFQQRRRLMVEGLRALPGITCEMPQGAFYAFPRFDPDVWGGDDVVVCKRLIDEAGVATTPGSAFGARGAQHLRFSYATSEATIREGLERIARLPP